MPLTNFRILPEVDKSLLVIADHSKERMVAVISRETLDDLLSEQSPTDQQRRALVQTNLEAIGSIITAKYKRHETTDYNRCGSTLKRVDLDMDDLRTLRR